MKVKKEIKEEELKVTTLTHIMCALHIAKGVFHYWYNCAELQTLILPSDNWLPRTVQHTKRYRRKSVPREEFQRFELLTDSLVFQLHTLCSVEWQKACMNDELERKRPWPILRHYPRTCLQRRS